jgi:GT2 family glycosyltransferase
MPDKPGTSAQPTPVVEALIVSYETRELLRQSILTLLAHPPDPSVARLEVAVFDNASSDGSAELVAKEFPQARLIRSRENVGFAAANDRLAATSTATYLLLLNPDVIVVEDLIGPLLAALAQNPAAAIAGPRLTSPDGEPQHSAQHFPTLRLELARALHKTKLGKAIRPLFDTGAVIARERGHVLLDERAPRRTDFLWATCWLMARADVERDGLFDERYTTYDEDLDFCRRLHRRGGHALFVPAVHLIHLGGSSSTSDAKASMMQRGRRRYFSDHHSRLTSFLYEHGVLPLLEFKRHRLLRRR